MLSRSLADAERAKPEHTTAASTPSAFANRAQLLCKLLAVFLCGALIACLFTAFDLATRYQSRVADVQNQHETALRAYSVPLAASVDQFDAVASQRFIDDMARLPQIHKVILQRNNQESLIAGKLQGATFHRFTQSLTMASGETVHSVGSITLVTERASVLAELRVTAYRSLLGNLVRVTILITLGLLAFQYFAGRHLSALAAETRRANRFTRFNRDGPANGNAWPYGPNSIATVLTDASGVLRTQREYVPADVRDLERENSELKKQLEAQRPLATLGAQFGTVVHEVRNPLAVVRASTQLLTLQLEDAHPGVKPLLQRMDNNAERCSRLLEMSRDVATGKSARVNPFEVNAWLKRYVDQFNTPSGVSLRFLPGEAAVLVDCDPFKVEHILRNLIENATHATLSRNTQPSDHDPDASPIDVAVSADSASHVQITVRDRGAGVTTDDLEQLFNPLFTTKPDGMGMGLPISIQIATLLGGALTLEPAETGTLARLTLPRVDIATADRH